MAEIAEADDLSSATVNVDSYVERMEVRLREFKALSSRQQAVIVELRSENAALREERDGLQEARQASSAEIARLCRGAAESAERVAELEAAASAIGATCNPDEGDGKHVFIDAREPNSQKLLQATCEGSGRRTPIVSVDKRDCQGGHGLQKGDYAWSSSGGNTTLPVVCSCESTRTGQSESRLRRHAELAADSNPKPGSLTAVVEKENSNAVNALDGSTSESSRPRGKEVTSHFNLKHVVRATTGKRTPVRSAQAVYASSRSAAKYAYSILRSTARG